MIKKIKSDIKASIKNKKVNVFFLFLFFAFVILIFTKLSKEYTNTITFKIDKKNVPQENIILNDSAAVLNITLKTHGFKWLKYYFDKPKIAIDFVKDVDKIDSTFVWSKSKAYLLESTQFGKQVELLNISPDTLRFKFDVNLVKKVPVILNADIQFTQGFDVVDYYKITPDSIEVIGPNVLVSQVNSIETKDLKMTDVKSDITEVVQLNLPINSNDLKFSNQTVRLTAKVEKFTEGTIKVPVIIKNVPNNKTLKYFPKTVNVTYYTSLNNFKSIKAKDFRVECDFSKATNNQSFLLLEISKYPETAKRVRINQQQIEFIITE
ncbi:YbbR-like domain-containing protein [Sabulilitoribacter arenilitoris]|uniref:YbbR-like domain-containing protein n=1 Tax=Wocania arenilitoris TaxID=2044858 RepID=A0AAE3JKK7_9FLAO|nr:YbbR-like domain-containing protein [Wocania arenilitoris]MCF7568193.1 YbbR-like domain-containing protein [Wocania arenilitoris]